MPGGLGTPGAPTVSADAFSKALRPVRTKTDAPVAVDSCSAARRCPPRRRGADGGDRPPRGGALLPDALQVLDHVEPDATERSSSVA